ncbi:MAG: hypothetical protein ACMUIS_04160 [bacterium]
MGKEGFKGYICRPFCTYFREGAKEDMACRGARVVESLLQAGVFRIDAIPINGKSPHLWAHRDEVLERTVCRSCPFRAEDCDFQSPVPPPGAEPCGGYILLSLLKEKGIITTADLEDSGDG